MAGYREFQTGEVLTAANVNDFLMDQSVMKFADAAARDTALGTAVGGANALREGMVAYLDSTDEIQVYDGTSWGGVGLPLGTATPTDGQILAFGTATSTWNPTNQLAGIGSNVVQTVKTDAFSTSSTTYVDVTGLTATITPTSATSKVLVIVSALLGGAFADGFMYAQVVRDSTAIGNHTSGYSMSAYANGTRQGNHSMFVYLDSPATTSATVYKVEAKAASQFPGYVGRNDTNNQNATSSITLIEVSA